MVFADADREASSSSRSAAPERPRRRFLAYAALVALVVAIFWPVAGFKFIDFDDYDYVRDNAVVRRGLTVDGLRWAFRDTGNLANWFPLTMLSHMLDVELFGVDAGRHHLVNLLFHAASATLLAAVLLRLTGAFWPAMLAAALFAAHPLRVESVAWVAERKDVLSTLLWIASMGAYAAYARRPGLLRYFALATLFSLGLMAKPMLVTLPFVLILLDFWPLGRFRPCELTSASAAAAARRVGRSLLEKAPLFLLAAGSAVVTLEFQTQGSTVVSLARIPVGLRLATVPLAYIWYLAKTIWPARLSLFYPHDFSFPPVWKVAAAAGALVAVTAAALALARRFPFLTMGWLFFVGTLAPVIGLVQVGEQFVADRYSYVPSIGLCVALAWAAWRIPCRTALATGTRAVAACAVVVALGAQAHRQVWRWRDNGALYAWALGLNPENWLANHGLGTHFLQHGRYRDAVDLLRAAVRLQPGDADAHNDLGVALLQAGDREGAGRSFRTALQLQPRLDMARFNLARVQSGAVIDTVVEGLYIALGADPDDPEAHRRLAEALLQRSRSAEAARQYEEVLRLSPGDAPARKRLDEIPHRSGLRGQGTTMPAPEPSNPP